VLNRSGLCTYFCKFALLVAICMTSIQLVTGQIRSRAGLEEGGPQAEFHMARMTFASQGGSGGSMGGPWRPWWAIDYPDAEYNFLPAVRRMTHINVWDDSIHLSVMDDRIFDHPWLFAQQVGRWIISAEEIVRLREYLLRGGFMIADDFHGPHDWQNFYNVIRRVFPDRSIIDLPQDDPVMQIFYDIDQRTQIPGRRHLYRTRSGEIDAHMAGPPAWKGIFDDDNRLMVAINFNMDMGDAWEHADDPVYPEPMTGFAYRLGINYLIYAFTH